MNDILLFAGTSEGREIAEACRTRHIGLTVSVATEYGETLIEQGGGVRVLHGRKNADEIEALIRSMGAPLVIDATHPYAKEITETLKAVTAKTGTEYLRVVRASEHALDAQCIFVPDTAAAVDALNRMDGNVLLTVGSKELSAYTAVRDWKNRLFARILPVKESAETAFALGFSGSRLICMQGPFSEAMNAAMLEAADAKILVTKDTGAAGGYAEKIRAAVRCGATPIVIRRPTEETGVGVQECIRRIDDRFETKQITVLGVGAGSGKTTITCGILKALKDRGRRVVSFKCGPDYIDPMFAQAALGIPSGTLDLFFCDPALLLRLYGQHADGADCAVVEGVMGYYDGLGAASDEASTYRVAQTLKAPVVLIVNARGQSMSALATLDGFLHFRPDSRIRGVIFNQMSKPVFDALAPEVRSRGVVPIGYLQKCDDLVIESRHLGLVTPDAVRDLNARLERLAARLSDTLNFDALEALMQEAEALDIPKPPSVPDLPRTRIAVACDEAFCFLYRDNLALLSRYGAELLFFSPLHDKALSDGAQGLILPGGYPELFARELSENVSMRESVKTAIENGMPSLAECGGFLYLHRALEDMQGTFYPMCGVLDAQAVRTEKLSRFGYVTLFANGDGAFFKAGESIRAHEFHYYESEDCGAGFTAKKLTGNRSWTCMHADANRLWGFPHLFYESNPKPIERFLRACARED